MQLRVANALGNSQPLLRDLEMPACALVRSSAFGWTTCWKSMINTMVYMNIELIRVCWYKELDAIVFCYL